jgi:TatD DNase family protein
LTLIDTHAHLDFPEFSDLPSILERAKRKGIDEIITIGINLSTSQRAVELAQAHSHIYATVGVHPHGARRLDEGSLAVLHRLAQQGKVIAIGEIGLDYYRDRQPRDIQRECLRQQMEIARKVSLPVVFHIRDAYEDFLIIVRDYVPALKGLVLHCFSGNWETAKQCLDLGFYLSIPGTVTFPKAQIQQEVVKRMPLNRLLLETDAPFLAPVPYRGKTNEPALMIHTAQKVAELRQLPLEQVAAQTTLNAHRVFNL